MTKDFCVHCMEQTTDGICRLCGRTNDEYQPAFHFLQPGSMLAGKYQIGSVLGTGGFGITYIGRDVNLDLRVAIKEYYPNGYVSRNHTVSKDITANLGEGEEIFEKGKSNFLREARTLAKFADEPNIVSVKDFFSENNTAYIVMEYIDGISLGSYLKRYKEMTFETCLDMMRPVMFALSKIHEKGLVHRDISPANILVMKDGTVKLLDFGATREFNSDEKTLSILLNPRYAPQEQYSAKGHQGPWTDVYAVATTMYRMLTGVAPENAMDRALEDELKSIRETNGSVTQAQEQVIFKAMALHQKDRYQSISEFYEACEKSLISNEIEEKVVVMQEKAVEYVDKGGRAEDTVALFPHSSACKLEAENQTVQDVEKPTSEKNYFVGEISQPQWKETQKENIWFLVAAFAMGIVAYVVFCGTLQSYLKRSVNRDVEAVSMMVSVLCACVAVWIGKLYFVRADIGNKKPNLACLIAAIMLAVVIVVGGVVQIVQAQQWQRPWYVVAVLLALVFPSVLSRFFVSRLSWWRNIAKGGKQRKQYYVGCIVFGFLTVFLFCMTTLKYCALLSRGTLYVNWLDQLSFSHMSILYVFSAVFASVSVFWGRISKKKAENVSMRLDWVSIGLSGIICLLAIVFVNYIDACVPGAYRGIENTEWTFLKVLCIWPHLLMLIFLNKRIFSELGIVKKICGGEKSIVVLRGIMFCSSVIMFALLSWAVYIRTYGEESSDFGTAVVIMWFVLLFGAIAAICGRICYEQARAVEEGPNILCLILSIFALGLPIVLLWNYVLPAVEFYGRYGSFYSAGEWIAFFGPIVICVILSFFFPIFFGAFFFGRLKKR